MSGGVDSLALAYLASQLTPRISVHAFIVDHSLRAESRHEAHAVAKLLGKLAVPASVLCIDWPAHVKPLQMRPSKNFESLARKYRYRALGAACQNHGIKDLLLAHHFDDQAETVLLRLLEGHQRWGLTGMATEAAIPECHDLFAVRSSGFRISAADQGKKPSSEPCGDGIRIYRPLLAYPKSRLIATCQHANLEWFEDPTNTDVKLTKRNAVRHLLREHRVPHALQPAHLVSLAVRLRDAQQKLEDQVDQWLQTCQTQWEPRSGVLIVTHISPNPGINPRQRSDLAVRLMRRFIEQVAPIEHVRLSTLQSCIHTIFPDISLDTEPSHPPVTGPPKPFNTASTLVSPVSPTTWQFSRQLPYTGTQSRFTVTLDVPATSRAWTAWTLFDHRYWLRLRQRHRHRQQKHHQHQHLTPHANTSPSTTQLHIRTRTRLFCNTDMANLRKRLGTAQRVRLEGLLRAVACGSVRYTLPVVEVWKDAQGNDEADKGEGEGDAEGKAEGAFEIAGLPTLGWWIGGSRVECEIRSVRDAFDGNQAPGMIGKRREMSTA